MNLVPQQHRLKTGDLLAAARAADMAAMAETPEQEMAAFMAIAAHQETIQIALMNQHINAIAAAHVAQERLPLREEGDDIGVVEARIPKDLAFHFMQQRNFGWEGFSDDGGMHDFLKAYPQCRVKTVSGKTVSGWTPRGQRRTARKEYARFAPGTLVIK